MKRIVVLFLLIGTVNVFGQIAGVSASKLLNVCTDPVPPKTIEFEPSVAVGFSKGFYNSDSKFNSYLKNQDSLNVASNLSFRFTYGVMKNLEIGFLVPASMNDICIGAKYKFPFSFKKSTTFGALAGVNLPLGNKGYRLSENKNNGELFTYGIAGGVIISHFFTKDFSVDFNAVTQKNFPSATNKDFNTSAFFAGADFGYYFIKGIQAIIGFNYSSFDFNDENLRRYSFVLDFGFTIEQAKNFLLVLNTPVTIAGKNIDKTFGFGFALTTTID